MQLWLQWWNIVSCFRPAFSRFRTFQWFVLVLVTFSVRSDLAGVTSFIRALNLKPETYHRLLAFFHSNAVDLDRLTSLWLSIVLSLFPVHRWQRQTGGYSRRHQKPKGRQEDACGQVASPAV
jgi:hypothetical protein